MDSIQIRVSKKRSGYTFCILPSVRRLIKSWSPSFHPATTISVSYDTGIDFELNFGIYSALLGIDNISDLIGKVNEIQFIESQTGKVLHSHQVVV